MIKLTPSEEKLEKSLRKMYVKSHRPVTVRRNSGGILLTGYSWQTGAKEQFWIRRPKKVPTLRITDKVFCQRDLLNFARFASDKIITPVAMQDKFREWFQGPGLKRRAFDDTPRKIKNK